MAMSESKWRETRNARAMLRHLSRGKESDFRESRKWRLFMAACAYGMWDHLPLPSQIAVEAGEAYADQTISEEAIGNASYVAEGVVLSIDREFARINYVEEFAQNPSFGSDPRIWEDYVRRCETWGLNRVHSSSPYPELSITLSKGLTLYSCSCFAYSIAWGPPANFDRDFRSLPYAADLLRDIFFNPYKPLRFDSRWRTFDTLGLAEGIYEDRAFDRLPILADALEDAGCEDAEILDHCRKEKLHVRGCWVIDALLGKS